MVRMKFTNSSSQLQFYRIFLWLYDCWLQGSVHDKNILRTMLVTRRGSMRFRRVLGKALGRKSPKSFFCRRYFRKFLFGATFPGLFLMCWTNGERPFWHWFAIFTCPVQMHRKLRNQDALYFPQSFQKKGKGPKKLKRCVLSKLSDFNGIANTNGKYIR